MNLSLFGCSLGLGRVPTSSGLKLRFLFKTKQHKKDLETSKKWERKALMYYDKIQALESTLRALDPSFAETHKPVNWPYK